MSEADAIGRTIRPGTVTSITDELRELGVAPDMTLMVHASLSRLGFVAGGAHAVVLALLQAVGPTGTLMMPTHSSDLSDPAPWQHPPVPAAWWDTIRQETPAYDPNLTPTRHMGAVVECFRHVPGVRRSAHPTVSAAAVGPNAAALVDGHTLDFGLGEPSPQARLYDLDGHILLLGVTHANNTSLHLAEHRSAPPGAPTTLAHSPVLVDGRRTWATYTLLADDDSDFARIGEDFMATGRQRSGRVGAGVAHLMRSRDLVDFATAWMAQHRHRG